MPVVVPCVEHLVAPFDLHGQGGLEVISASILAWPVAFCICSNSLCSFVIPALRRLALYVCSILFREGEAPYGSGGNVHQFPSIVGVLSVIHDPSLVVIVS